MVCVCPGICTSFHSIVHSGEPPCEEQDDHNRLHVMEQAIHNDINSGHNEQDDHDRLHAVEQAIHNDINLAHNEQDDHNRLLQTSVYGEQSDAATEELDQSIPNEEVMDDEGVGADHIPRNGVLLFARKIHLLFDSTFHSEEPQRDQAASNEDEPVEGDDEYEHIRIMIAKYGEDVWEKPAAGNNEGEQGMEEDENDYYNNMPGAGVCACVCLVGEHAPSGPFSLSRKRIHGGCSG